MRSKLLAVTVVALALGLGAPVYATSSSPSTSGSGNGSNVELHGSGWSYGVSFQGYQFGSGSGLEQYVVAAIDALRSGGHGFNFFGNGYKKKPPRDAGKVPEPGAVGVFSVGLLVAGALIRRLGRKA